MGAPRPLRRLGGCCADRGGAGGGRGRLAAPNVLLCAGRALSCCCRENAGHAESYLGETQPSQLDNFKKLTSAKFRTLALPVASTEGVY